ncbi:MAG: hypothetical protein EZS28_004882 [Streblomastix strix]|uniref:C2H2-type domain-containing protein n=1 Tax=Streblomastix strix TaxID=222440 RepID=A0A5J4WX11_9EUKA|nr:MAG: hypothetical protein EZS28_004882 [Streblomastix strix]
MQILHLRRKLKKKKNSSTGCWTCGGCDKASWRKTGSLRSDNRALDISRGPLLTIKNQIGVGEEGDGADAACEQIFDSPASPEHASQATTPRKRHARWGHQHSGKYICTEAGCGYRAMSKSDLEKHARTHTRERPFTCKAQGCNRTFSQTSHLYEHMRKAHGMDVTQTRKKTRASSIPRVQRHVFVQELKDAGQFDGFSSDFDDKETDRQTDKEEKDKEIQERHRTFRNKHIDSMIIPAGIRSALQQLNIDIDPSGQTLGPCRLLSHYFGPTIVENLEQDLLCVECGKKLELGKCFALLILFKDFQIFLFSYFI